MKFSATDRWGKSPQHERFSSFGLISCCCLLFSCLILPGKTLRAEEVVEETNIVRRIRQDIEYLASEELAGRRGLNSRKAGDYIVSELKRLKLSPVFPDGSYYQTIPGPVTETGEKTALGWNVAGLLKGQDESLAEEYIIVAAHHDHLGSGADGVFAGADDNASGVAMLLEIARQLSQDPPPRSVLFVSFDLEEHLLFGSRWFVAHPPVAVERMRFLVVADMLGRSLGDMPLNSFFVFGSEHASGIQDSLSKISFPKNCQPVLLSDDFVGTRSDYGPFREREVPFIFVSTGQSRDYHTVRDTADKINFAQVAGITAGLAELVREVAQTSTPPEWIQDPPPDLKEVEAVLKIVNMIEQHARKWELNALQNMFVVQARRQAEQILKEEKLTPESRAWLTRTTQLLLFSVF